MSATSEPWLTDDEMDALIDVAAASIRAAVLDGWSWTPSPGSYSGRLSEPGAAFVSLHLDKWLRGCVGTLSRVSPLVVTVADRARDAATADPRFRPVEPFELPGLHIDVSVLSSLEEMDVHSYRALLEALRPGIDGLIVEVGVRHATLLPSVWADLRTPQEFVAALWFKAGIDSGAWPWGTRVARYTAQHAGRMQPALGRTFTEPRPPRDM